MGCATSKQVGARAPVVVYRPSPSSFAVFDITSIEEPWLKFDTVQEDDQHHKPSHVPPPLLEKLDTLEKEVSNGPRTWDEVSKVLQQDLQKPTTTAKPGPNPSPNSGPTQPNKSFSFHTVEELDAPKTTDGNKHWVVAKANRLRKTESMPVEAAKRVEREFPGPDPGEFRSVKANPFIMKDRMEREKEGKEAAFDKIMKAKKDPMSDFREICPPGGAQLVVLYTTSLRGVRRTFEDCNRVRTILETHRVVFDERDVSLHPGFLTELRELVGPTEGVVPRLFVKGRYLGGPEEVVELNESGRLGRVMSWARVERGPGWQGCEGCGGARFVPCLNCGGSCKVLVGENKERCPKCNENGLVHCPRCH